jgi:NADPH-dependent 2,4-dienoyl-CoA reductase/sulfur reductase-like enzyme
VPADLVVLGIGVKARSALAADAGLPTGVKDGIVVGADQRVVGHGNVWAAGDCALSRHRLTGELVHIALGTHANKQGWVAARNIAGADAEFAGVLGTAITKICQGRPHGLGATRPRPAAMVGCPSRPRHGLVLPLRRR